MKEKLNSEARTVLYVIEVMRQISELHFLVFQVGENEPFVSELLSSLLNTVGDLEPHQIHTFYESVRKHIPFY